MNSKLWRVLALFLSFSLLAAACGDDDDDTTTETTAAEDEGDGDDEGEGDEEEPFEIGEAPGLGDGTFSIARVLPETGALGFLGAPMIAGTSLAVQDINEAGGLFGNEVDFLEFDSATDPTVALPNVNNAFAQGADVLVGAGASSITKSTLDGLSALGIPSCTPSATSGELSSLRTAEKLFRTVPSDEFVVGIIANEIVQDGNAEKVVIVARADAYGDFLAEELAPALEAVGVASDSVVTIKYDPNAADLSAEAGQVAAENPTAVVIVGFDEAGPLIRTLIEDPNGLDPNTFYGADGVFSSQLPDLAGVSIDGMKVIGAAGSNEFNQRLADAGTPDFIYGGQAYDCTILLALWAALEGTDDSSQWDPANLAGLTKEGEKCTTFADCLALIEEGTDIDYDGVSGPLEMQPGNPDGEGTAGEPTVSVYAVAQFSDGALEPVSSTEVDLT